MEIDSPQSSTKRKAPEKATSSAKKTRSMSDKEAPPSNRVLTKRNSLTSKNELQRHPPRSEDTPAPNSTMAKPNPTLTNNPPDAQRGGRSARTVMNNSALGGDITSINALINSIQNSSPSTSIKEDVAKAVDLFMEAKNLAILRNMKVSPIELAVLRNAIVKTRADTANEEEDPIVPVIVAEHVKEDFQLIWAFFNLTRSLDVDNTVLFPQARKHSAIFAFTSDAGQDDACKTISKVGKEWKIIEEISELKQSDCSYDTPHTAYIYAPDLPLDDVDRAARVPIKSSKATNGLITVWFYMADDVNEFIVKRTIDTHSGPVDISASYVRKTEFKLRLKGTPNRWKLANLRLFLKSQGVTVKEAEIARSLTDRQNLLYSWIKFDTAQQMVEASLKSLITITGDKLTWEELKKRTYCLNNP